jgi:hypothetical protein
MIAEAVGFAKTVEGFMKVHLVLLLASGRTSGKCCLFYHRTEV